MSLIQVVQPYWVCERCAERGHLAEQCWVHCQYPYGYDRRAQVAMLKGALEYLLSEQTPAALERGRDVLRKLGGPPCDGPPTPGQPRK